MKNYIKLGDYKHEITDKQIEQFKKLLGEDKKKHWVPKEGEKFFYVAVDYIVYETHFSETSPFDKILIATGNARKTRGEAQAVADKKLKYDTAVETVKRWIADEFGVFEPDFTSGLKAKFTFYYNYESEKIETAYNHYDRKQSDIGYLRSEEDCQKLLKALPEEMDIIFK